MKRYLFFLCAALLFTSALLAQKWDTLAPIPEKFTFPVVDVVNGEIHIMGGGGAGGATNHHFAYNPATNIWTSRALLPYVAQQPAGATANGKIHFFGGGYPNTGTPLKQHHIYDPATDSWTKAADLTAARAIHYAVTLNDVLYSLAGQGMANLCQTYDPIANAWTTKNNLPDNGFWYGAHVATEGHIYRFCGGGYTAPNKLAHRYDPATDKWTVLPAFPAATHGLRGAAIGNKIYIAGGYHSFLEREEVYVFDTQTEQYSPGIPLPLGRNYHNMVALDSCIYVIGGNHAIDQTVGTQLLRLCPFDISSPTRELSQNTSLEVRYSSGKLLLTLPEGWQEAAQLAVFDMAGRQVFVEKLGAGHSGEIIEIAIGNLLSSVYVVRLQTKNAILVGKISAN